MKIFKKISLVLLVIFIMVIMPLGVIANGGTTHYVDAVNGHDDTGNGSFANPYQTINKGLSVASAGDTVEVMAGTYNEDIVLMNGIVLQGVGAGVTTIHGSGDPNNNPWCGAVVVMSDQNGATKLDGFTITGGNGLYAGGVVCLSGSPIVSNNIITHNDSRYGGGIGCWGGSLSTIINNIISYNGSANTGLGGGIHYEGAGGIARNNIITHNHAVQGGGIWITGGLPAISSCTITQNSADWGAGGVFCEGDCSPPIYDCIIWGNSSNDVVGLSCMPVYSCVGSGVTSGEGVITDDPLFVDAESDNYHLQAASPCKLAGILSDTYTVYPSDYDGNLRPTVGGHVTMGAYELCTAPVFVNLPGLDQLINLTEGQVVTQNPYTIRVLPQDEIGITRVEFYVDGVLIGTDTTADADGTYSWNWDTGTYHSLVRVVAYNDLGLSVELTRNTTVMLEQEKQELPYTGK